MHKTKGKNTYVVDCSMHDLLVDDMNAEGCALAQQGRLILPYFRIPQLSSGGGPEIGWLARLPLHFLHLEAD